MPSAKGLFHRAIIQSGAGLSGGTRERANQTAETLLKELGLKPGQGRELQNVPLDRLMDAGNKARFGTVVDGKVLPANPFEPVASPLSADIPVIVGYTRTERTVYEIDSPTFGKLDEGGLLESVKRLLGEEAEHIIASYRKRYPKASPYDLATNISGDAGAMSSIRLAEIPSVELLRRINNSPDSNSLLTSDNALRRSRQAATLSIERRGPHC